jgi:hypothetical protein
MKAADGSPLSVVSLDRQAQAREGLVNIHIRQARADRAGAVGAKIAQLFAGQDTDRERRT